MSTDLTREIPVKTLMERYRDAERFIAYCRQCECYGRQWSCPPFTCDVTAQLSRFTTATIIATIINIPPDTPIGQASEILLPERRRIENWLLNSEQQLDGRAFTTIGRCTLCHPDTCTRITGHPCRHPDRVRPSLEAVGFDISAILSDLFGLTLQWGADGLCPPRLILVTALFHNNPLPREK